MKKLCFAIISAAVLFVFAAPAAQASSFYYGDRDRAVAVNTGNSYSVSQRGHRHAAPPPLSPQEIAIIRKSAAHHLGRPLDDHVFQGNQRGPTPPRPGCKLDKRVRDGNVTGLNHAGWLCPRQY